MDVLQAALGVAGRADAERLVVLLVPDRRQVARRQVIAEESLFQLETEVQPGQMRALLASVSRATGRHLGLLVPSQKCGTRGQLSKLARPTDELVVSRLRLVGHDYLSSSLNGADIHKKRQAKTKKILACPNDVRVVIAF